MVNTHSTAILLNHNADVNLQNNEGLTSLMMASYSGCVRIVEILVKQGADLNIASSIGNTALTFSTKKGYSEVSQLLTELGARHHRKRSRSQREFDPLDTPPVSKQSELEERVCALEEILQTLRPNQATETTSSLFLSATPTLREALKLLLPLAYDWQTIGVMLNLDNNELKCIDLDCSRVARHCLREMLNLWLKRAIPPTTWEELARALEDADHEGTACKIRRL